MRTNRPNVEVPVLTAPGARASRISNLLNLRRSVLAAFLYEDTAYQKGGDAAKNVAELIAKCQPEDVAKLAIEARERMYLRHTPLFLVRELARTKGNGTLVADTLERVIQRPDELTEFLALYWKDGRTPVSAGSKRGLARAFKKFDGPTLAKYNRSDAIKLRDVLRIVHPNPGTSDLSKVWKDLIAGELASPDTWEVELSAGKDKKLVFERLLRERKLGGLAFLRNLRNMIEAKVDEDLIKERFKGGFKYVLPFRFIAAAKYAPRFEPYIEEAMLKAAGELPKLTGKTVLVLDTSGSMGSQLSSKSEMSRLDAAIALAILAREQCEDVRVFCTAGDDYSRKAASCEIVPRRGMALKDALLADCRKIGGGGIFLTQAMDYVSSKVQGTPDRLIVFTDEQDCSSAVSRKLDPDQAKAFARHNYLVNISNERNGIGYGKWTHIDGFSERVLDFMIENEDSSLQ